MTRHISLSPDAEAGPATEAWWQVSAVWLVIAVPAVAVAASVAMLITAIRLPDPVLPTGEAARAGQVALPAPKSLLPALTGRNHAATPAPDLPSPKP